MVCLSKTPEFLSPSKLYPSQGEKQMRLHMTVEATVISLCFSLLASGEATAASFTFTKIADTNSFFRGLSSEPSINDMGTVAFLGTPQTEISNLLTGVFTSDGITTTTIADDSGSFFAFGDPSINNPWYFYRVRSSGRSSYRYW